MQGTTGVVCTLQHFLVFNVDVEWKQFHFCLFLGFSIDHPPSKRDVSWEVFERQRRFVLWRERNCSAAQVAHSWRETRDHGLHRDSRLCWWMQRKRHGMRDHFYTYHRCKLFFFFSHNIWQKWLKRPQRWIYAFWTVMNLQTRQSECTESIDCKHQGEETKTFSSYIWFYPE